MVAASPVMNAVTELALLNMVPRLIQPAMTAATSPSPG